MKKFLLVLVGVLFTFTVSSQEEKKNLYSGGMLILQPGMTITSNEHQDIRHMSTAVGGILRLYFCNYLTAGLYGGSQKTNYPTAGSKTPTLILDTVVHSSDIANKSISLDIRPHCMQAWVLSVICMSVVRLKTT